MAEIEAVMEGRRGESVVAEEDRGEDSEAEVELNSEGEEVDQEWHPDRGNLNVEMALIMAGQPELAQRLQGLVVEEHELAQRLQRLEEEDEPAAARGQGWSGRQRGGDSQGVGSGERVSVECQAWVEAKLTARGELEVPHLCSQQSGAQEWTGEEVQIVASVVKVEGKQRRQDGLEKAKTRPAKAQRTASRGTPGQRAQGEVQKQKGVKQSGHGKKAKGQPQGGVRSNRGQRAGDTGRSGDREKRG